MFANFINRLRGEVMEPELRSYYGHREVAMRKGFAQMSESDALQVLLHKNLEIVNSIILFLDSVVEEKHDDEGNSFWYISSKNIVTLHRMMEVIARNNGVKIKLSPDKIGGYKIKKGTDNMFLLEFVEPIVHTEWIGFHDVDGDGRFSLSPQY